MKKLSGKKGKGVSMLISHTAFIAVGLTALIIVSFLLWWFYDAIVKEQIRKDLSASSQAVANEILQLYSLKGSSSSPGANKSVLLGESSLSLQQKAAGRQYMIELLQTSQITVTNFSEGNVTRYATQIIAFTSEPQIQANYTLYNIDAKVQGSGFGDRPLVLRYYRLNFNGTIEDRIALNDAIIMGGESIG